MSIFSKKKNLPEFEYDPDIHRPVIKCSICNGEQVAGFKDKQSGHFTEVMLVKNSKDLEIFKEKYNITDVTKEY